MQLMLSPTTTVSQSKQIFLITTDKTNKTKGKEKEKETTTTATQKITWIMYSFATRIKECHISD